MNLQNLPELILERWPEAIEIQDYPELMDLIMKSILRNGQWELPDGRPDPRQIKRLMEAVIAGQAPAVKGFMSDAERRRVSSIAGEDVSSYADLERRGFSLEQPSRAPSKPTLRERVSREVQQDKAKYQVPDDLVERMKKGEQFTTVTEPNGAIRFVPAHMVERDEPHLPDERTVDPDLTEEGESIDDVSNPVTPELLMQNARENLNRRRR